MLQSSLMFIVRRALFVGAASLMWIAASSFAQGGMGAPGMDGNPRALPENSCITDPASCGLTAEDVAGLQACRTDPRSEACVAFRESRLSAPPPALPDKCVNDPASCGLTAEDVAGIQACQADPQSEACVAFRASKGRPEACQTDPASEDCQRQVGRRPQPDCHTNPARCAHPGPAIFDVDNKTLYVQAVRFRQNGQLLPQFYGIELTFDAASGTLSLTHVEQLLNLLDGNTQ